MVIQLQYFYVLAINKVANSIAYPLDLQTLDSSSRISDDSDVASEKFRGFLYPDLGKSSRKKVFFSKEYFHKEKRGARPFSLMVEPKFHTSVQRCKVTK